MDVKFKAFTLIELLVVIAIVGILSGFIAIRMNGAINAANDARKKTTVDTIKKAVVIDKVISGSYPIESGCTIGNNCSNLNPVIQKYLPADLDGTYTYQSDGSTFAVASVLSSGYSYQYDSVTSTYSTNQPVNGTCGSIAGANLSSSPTTNLCTTGTISAVAGTGPWTWSCSGIYGGTSAACATGAVPLNGSCGTANGSNSYTVPSANLCAAGTPSTVTGSGPWAWNCNGSSGGLSPVCASNISINGACGSSNGANLSSAPSTNLCNAGSSSSVTGTGPWNWTCAGTNGGTTPACATGGVPVNGTCGSSNGANLSSAPSTNLCNNGSATTVTGSGPWAWNCNGLNTGSNVSCATGAIPVNGACGSSNGANLSSAPSTNLCNNGSATTVTGSGPWAWSCTGVSGGTTASCSATKLSVFVASDTVQYTDASQFDTSSTSYVTAKTFTMAAGIGTGSFRIKFKVWGNATDGRSNDWQVLKNGTVIWSDSTKAYSSNAGAWTNGNGFGSDVTYNLSGISQGDVIVLQCKMRDGYTQVSHISNLTIGYTQQ